MSERDEVLYKLAKLQEKPPRSARDLAVLEAAKAKAVINRQKVAAPVKTAESFWSFLSKPMWLGTGSLAAAALSVFIVFGHQVSPEEKVVQPPVAAVPAPASAPAPEVAKIHDEERPAPSITIKRDTVPPKKEAVIPASKKVIAAEVETTEIAKALPEPAAVASAPLAAEVPASAAALRSQTSIPPSQPSGRIAVAAAPAPAIAADGVARKRESGSALVAPNTCLLDIKAIPLERQTLAFESTKQLLLQCAQSIPKSQWPADIDWAKKLLDLQREKSLLNATEKPQ
jgi:hypothetical protein